jgi:aryl carrier-like protein
VPYRKPKTKLEKVITGLWSSLLQFDKIGLDDNFFELGGNSLLAQKSVAALKLQGYSLPITKLYQHPTAAGIARYMDPQQSGGTARPVSIQSALQPDTVSPGRGQADVAVIGMAGRFPGAATIDELWEVLKLVK